MTDREHFWRLEHLSDRQLLERLQSVLRTQRCALAELIAHLGEVEERRLHLAAAHGSMFSYCVQHLGMSEDEACRRIDLARLARRFPVLFGELASGRVSLSVALLLKPVLTPDNHAELFAAARGASLRTARELLAARFPSPDVPSRIRKLPERLVATAKSAAMANAAHGVPAAANDVATTMPAAMANAAHAMPAVAADVANAIPAAPVQVANATPTPAAHAMPAAPAGVVLARDATLDATAGAATAPGPTSTPLRPPESEHGSLARVHPQSWLQSPTTPAELSQGTAQACVPHHAGPRQRIDPLSPERYRIQFTADASVKQKLELARDLLRHSHPNGDFAPIFSRALDLLLQQLLQRRFGSRRKDTPHRATRPTSRAAPTAPAVASESPPSSTLPSAMPASAPRLAASPAVTPSPTARTAFPLAVPSFAASPAATSTSHIARAARRAVLERDGLGCCWVDGEGKRCGSTAWLELDHHQPSGKGGSSEPDNVRLLCRAHNRFAAERAYGRDHVERAIRARQQRAKRRRQSGHPPPSSPAPA